MVMSESVVCGSRGLYLCVELFLPKIARLDCIENLPGGGGDAERSGPGRASCACRIC